MVSDHTIGGIIMDFKEINLSNYIDVDYSAMTKENLKHLIKDCLFVIQGEKIKIDLLSIDNDTLKMSADLKKMPRGSVVSEEDKKAIDEINDQLHRNRVAMVYTRGVIKKLTDAYFEMSKVYEGSSTREKV